MADFEKLLGELKAGILEIAKKEAVDYAREFRADGEAFLLAAQEDLERWAGQAARGELTAKQLERLIRGKRSVAEMRALKQAGIAAARIDALQAKIVSLVIKVLTRGV